MYRAGGIALLFCLLMTEVAADPYPIDYWARRNAVTEVALSPDGSQFALTRILERGGNPIIELYDSDDLAKDPVRIDSSPSEIMPGIEWIDDDVFLFYTRQKVRDIIEGFNRGVYEYQIVKYDSSKKNPLGRIRQEAFSVEEILPARKNKIIISSREDVSDRAGTNKTFFRPRSYWEYDLKTNRRKLLMRGKLSLGRVSFNSEGEATHAYGYDFRTNDFVYYWRPPGTKEWREMHRHSQNSFEDFIPIYPDPAAENSFLVLAQNGHDKQGLWSFNAEKQEFTEVIYRRNDVDGGYPINHSNRHTNPDELVGIRWCEDTCHQQFFNAEEAALYRQLESIIPNADQVRVSDRSRDGNTYIVTNFGPRAPGTYYLIRNGKMSKISGAKPYLEHDQLAKVEYVTYKARDGVEINGYVTVPNGEGPFPLVVMPHGGPYVSETVNRFDEWAQLLANYGYMVLQPQYRGSKKYGLDFYQSAFINGSEAGRAMQDDKDDGALHLVRQGRVDPNRMAMFGWSYGGYAALVAASRKDQIYQCVIAGAAVTDPEMQVDYYRYGIEGAQEVEQVTTWDGAISPIKEVENINVPMLIVHGDVDQRVPPEHFDKYIAELDRAGIDYQKLILEEVDHFSDTFYYRHKLEFYETMLDFLENDCGSMSTGDSLANR